MTAYHPQAKGLVERLHKQLKGALKARLSTSTWMTCLPIILLGIRSSWRDKLDTSLAGLVYGSALRLPGKFVGEQAEDEPTTDYLCTLQLSMRELQQVIPILPDWPVYIQKDLATASHVWLRNDAVKRPLQCPYDGPFAVYSRSPKYFEIDHKGRWDKVSIDRLKPATCAPIAAELPPVPADWIDLSPVLVLDNEDDDDDDEDEVEIHE
jgi:hypothetical protein